jgi:mRNA interferase MazF
VKSIKRGEIWTGAGSGNYAKKPRPVLILESEEFQISNSDIVALITSDDEQDLGILRYKLIATQENGLKNDSYICLDKLTAISVNRLRNFCGIVDDTDMLEIERRLARILHIRKDALQ